jgi:hypothetical protein
MALAHNKKMDTALYALLEAMVDYGVEFDVDEVDEHLRDNDLYLPFMKKDPVDTASKSLALWKEKAEKLQQKLDEGTSKDEDKDREALTKLEEKIEAQEAKVEALKHPETAHPPAKKTASAKKAAPASASAKKAAPAVAEKRIKRMTVTITKQLTESLKVAGLDLTEDLKAEFRQYVEDMSQDDYVAKNLKDHIADFAKKNGSPPTTDDAETSAGAEEDPDEDMLEVTFKGTDYVVGEKTNRVYRVNPSGADVFEGFVKIGKFKDMVVA